MLLGLNYRAEIFNFIFEFLFQSIEKIEEEEEIILEKSLNWQIDKDTIISEEVEESTDFNLNSSKKLELSMNGNK